MKIPTIFNLLLVGAVFLSQAYGKAESVQDDELTPCQEPRPEICTQDYTPVCGKLANGERRTYPNACSACAKAEVVGYAPGECP